MNIRTKILILILIIVLLTGCIGMLVGRNMAMDALKDQINAQLAATAQAKSRNIQNLLDKQKETLWLLNIEAVYYTALSQAGGLTKSSGPSDYETLIGSIMSSIAMSSQHIREAVYLDSKGMVLTSSYTGMEDSFANLDLSKVDFSSMNFNAVDWSKLDFSKVDLSKVNIPNAIASDLDFRGFNPTKATIQDPRMRDPDQTDFSRSPIYLKGKEGIFTGDIKLKDDASSFVLATAQPFYAFKQLAGIFVLLGGEDMLAEIAGDREGLGDTGEVYIVNEDGFMLTPSRFIENAVLKQQVKLPAVQVENGNTGAVGEPAPAPEPIVGKNYRGAKVIGIYQKLPDTGWTVVVEEGYGEAFAPVSDLTRNMLWLLLACLALGAVAAVFFSNALSGPIVKLRRGAEQIMEGNWNYNVAVSSRDEVGDLSRAFGKMASTLHKTQEELQDYSARLEKKIEERTQELSAANTELQKAGSELEERVEERTWELLNANNNLLQEVKERKAAEEKLRESETKYRAIVENSLIGIGISCGDRILYANQALVKIHGYTDFEEFASKSLDDSLTPESREFISQWRRKKAAGEAVPMEFEHSFIRKDGEIRILRLSITDVTVNNQTYVHSTSIDVTESKRMEKALKESEKLYRLLAENASDVIWTMDMDRRFTYVSPSVTRLWGYSVEEAMALSLEEILPPQSFQELAQVFVQELQRVLADPNAPPRPATIEFEQYCKGGAIVWSQAVVSFLRDPNKKPVGLVGVTRDVTERKRAQDKVQASLAEKEMLLKEIHHRVKNNLQIISSLLNLQKEGIKDEDSRAMFEDSGRRVRSMALIHEQLYRSGNLARIDFANYVRELSGNLLHSCNNKTQAIRLDIRGDGVFLGIDAAVPCGLIINEIITNSIKYAFPERWKGNRGKDISPEIRIELTTNNARELTLLVADNGIGLPEGIDCRNTETLGLQLVTSLADQLGATLDVSREGGTAFRITFPVN